MTKSRLQKEDILGKEQYKKLIVASLKYLGMKVAGHKVDYTWEKMQQGWNVINDCLNEPWKEHVFLPIDYQVVEAFELDRLSVCKSNVPKLEMLNPRVVVVNQAYGGIQLDFSRGNGLVNRVVEGYLAKNWMKPDFTPYRYPLGIKQHVTFSDHQIERVIYLRDQAKIHGNKEVALTLERIEKMLNGYGEASLRVADPYLTGAERRNTVVVINRKPGLPDLVSQQRIASQARWLI